MILMGYEVLVEIRGKTRWLSENAAFGKHGLIGYLENLERGIVDFSRPEGLCKNIYHFKRAPNIPKILGIR